MRKAFDTPEDPYLPQHILYRQKEQFSDGVGYNWIDELRGKAEQEVGQDLLRRVAFFFFRGRFLVVFLLSTSHDVA